MNLYIYLVSGENVVERYGGILINGRPRDTKRLRSTARDERGMPRFGENSIRYSITHRASLANNVQSILGVHVYFRGPQSYLRSARPGSGTQILIMFSERASNAERRARLTFQSAIPCEILSPKSTASTPIEPGYSNAHRTTSCIKRFFFSVTF